MQFTREEEITAELNMSEYVVFFSAFHPSKVLTIEKTLQNMTGLKKTTKIQRSRLFPIFSVLSPVKRLLGLEPSRGTFPLEYTKLN